MKQSEIALVLESLGREQVHVTPILWGPTGIGKSEAVAQAAKRLGKKLIDIRLGERVDAADLIGIPFKFDDPHLGPVMDYHRPRWLKEAIKNGNCVLFFDEINRARKDILQGVFEIVRDRKFDGEPIADDVLIVCACNPPDERNQTVAFDDALTARFMHIKVDLDNTDWLEWAKKEKIHPSIVKYIQINPEALNRKDERDDDFPVDTYPNPRAWGLFVNAVMNTSLPDKLKRQCVRGVVGREQATAFFESFNLQDEPVLARHILEGDPSVIARIKKYSNPSDVRMDLLSATVTDCILNAYELLLKHEAFFDVLREMPKEQATACVRGLLDKSPTWAAKIKGDEALLQSILKICENSKAFEQKLRTSIQTQGKPKKSA